MFTTLACCTYTILLPRLNLTGCNDPDPVALPRASLSFLVKQPGGLGSATDCTPSAPSRCIPTRPPSKRVGVPLTVQSRPAFQNLFLHQQSFDSLKPLFLLPSSPHADKGPSHAHTINLHSATDVHRLRALRWGIDAPSPPPPTPHRHPWLLARVKQQPASNHLQR